MPVVKCDESMHILCNIADAAELDIACFASTEGHAV